MKQPPTLEPARLRTQLILVLTVIMFLVVAIFGFATLSAYDRSIEPELENRTRLIGSIVRDEVQRTLDLGIPMEALGGMESYLEATINQFPEVKRIAVIRGTSRVVAEVVRDTPHSLLQRSGLARAAGIGPVAFVLPILDGSELVGEIQVEGNPHFVATRLRDVFFDVGVLAIVALLAGVELALAVTASSVWKPYGRVLLLLDGQVSGRFSTTIRVAGISGIRRVAVRLNEQAEDLARRLRTLGLQGAQSFGSIVAGGLQRMRYSDFNDVRLALFLFATATEITASFLPLYARDAARPAWITPELAAAAPLALYLVAVALLSSFGRALTERFGARRVFVASTLPAAIALAGMGTAGSLVEIVLWRGLIGVFYALATIACQEYTIRAGRIGEATQSASAFVGMIFGGAFCGSVLGGVIGGRFGFPAALFLGAFLALVAGLVARSAMQGRAGEAHQPQAVSMTPVSATAPGSLPAFWSLVLGVSVPMSATTAIFIWYLVPLGLTQLGLDPAAIARVTMLYYLAAALLGPMAKRMTRGGDWPVLPIVAGAAIAGLALVFGRAAQDLLVFLAAVLGIGIGHALIRAPMNALAVQFAGGSTRLLGGLRIGERLGALAGLCASAFLLASYDRTLTLFALGAVTLAGAAVFVMVFRASARARGGE